MARKPVKKTARKVARKKSSLRRRPGELTRDQYALFDKPKPPSGYAYQWSPMVRVDVMRAKGWTQVPYSRHSDLPRALNFDGFIVYLDLGLFQIAAELHRAEIAALEARGRKQVTDICKLFGMEEGPSGFYKTREFGAVYFPPNFIASEPYDRHTGQAPVPVELTITLRVPPDWCDTANALKLSHGEYARRRVAMDDGMILAANPDGTFHPYHITTRKVD